MDFTTLSAAPAMRSRRKRGGLLIDIILGLLLLVGLLYGAYSYFQQGSTSRELADMNSRFVALSAEVRAQYAHTESYSGVSRALVEAGSTLPAAQFRNVTIASTDDNSFSIAISNLSEVVCTRLTNADLGPRVSDDTPPTCSGTGDTRTLTVTYTN